MRFLGLVVTFVAALSLAGCFDQGNASRSRLTNAMSALGHKPTFRRT